MNKAPLPAGIGLPLVPIYAAAVAHRNKRFDKGRGVRTPPVPVISVGNITVGGTGKTPMVQHLARVLKMTGRRPGIVLRGYGPHHEGLSDEHAEHRERSPDIPVLANPNRYEAVAQLIAGAAGHRPDCVILDDGFQHRRLRRHLDLVLVDATRDPFADRMLPAGWLREPVTALARASAVVLTRTDQLTTPQLNALVDRLAHVTGAPPIAQTKHAWDRQAQVFVDTRQTTKDISWLRGKSVVVACAIGNPTPFVNQVRLTGAAIADTLVFRDHAALSEKQARRIIDAASSADAIVCTAKDWVKLRRHDPAAWPCPVIRPTVTLEFLTGREELQQLALAALDKPTPGAAGEA